HLGICFDVLKHGAFPCSSKNVPKAVVAGLAPSCWRISEANQVLGEFRDFPRGRRFGAGAKSGYSILFAPFDIRFGGHARKVWEVADANVLKEIEAVLPRAGGWVFFDPQVVSNLPGPGFFRIQTPKQLSSDDFAPTQSFFFCRGRNEDA